MSKMTMPQMAAVHFTESDVIVASGDVLRIKGFGVGDGVPKNGVMTFHNVSYATNDYASSGAAAEALLAGLKAVNPNYGNSIDATASDPIHKTFDDLFEADWGALTYVTAEDGDYYWIDGMWRHQ